MTQQKLTGAALLQEVNQNPKMSDAQLAVRCGYTKITRSRSGEERVRPLLEAYYKAVLLAKGDFFGVVLPESQKTSSRSNVISFKILKTGSAVVPARLLRSLDCQPDDYVFIEEGPEEGTLLVRKDVERSEQVRLEAANNPESAGSFAAASEDDDEDEEEEDPDEIEEDDEEVSVQQPAIPGGVSSTTVRLTQPVPVS